ncbi:guanylyl cyclase C-like [Rhincodon typus]|uniref:guanylyl cyclase C-like n=1 Tax=Rhincodon typus TaxID=259920 RepID=UPI0020304DB4|nr:guanylyl cyclase C-like [Rhincodon typus]
MAREQELGELLNKNIVHFGKEKFPIAKQGEFGRNSNKDVYTSGFNVTLDATFNGFDTSLYQFKDCRSSACEGLENLKKLHKDKTLGCAVLGPTCTYATFQIVTLETRLEAPIVSAGSFGLSCDYRPNVTRILPTARKLSNFFVKFWQYESDAKPHKWNSTYFYKKEETTEYCFWYINGLEAGSAQFSSVLDVKEIIRDPLKFKEIVNNSTRKSNVSVPHPVTQYGSKIIPGKVKETVS